MQFTAEPLLDEEGVPLAVLTADTQAAIDELRAAARAAAEASRAPSSERAYAADWRRRHEAEFSKHVKDRRIGSRIEQTTSDRIIFCSKTGFGSQGASRATVAPRVGTHQVDWRLPLGNGGARSRSIPAAPDPCRRSSLAAAAQRAFR